MAAIHLRWPKALIQHEDFQTKHAVTLLKRYRSGTIYTKDIKITVVTRIPDHDCWELILSHGVFLRSRI